MISMYQYIDPYFGGLRSRPLVGVLNNHNTTMNVLCGDLSVTKQ